MSKSCPHCGSKMSFVYFMYRSDRRLVKIGKSVDPDRRVKQVYDDCSMPLTWREDAFTHRPARIHVMATMPGGHDLETKLHQEFADLRVIGEWFRMSPRLMSLVQSLNDYRGYPTEQTGWSWK